MTVLMQQVHSPGENSNWQVPLYHRVYRVVNNRVEVHENDIPLMMDEGFRIVEQQESETAPVSPSRSKPKGR